MIWINRRAEVEDVGAILRLEQSTPELPHWSETAYARMLGVTRGGAPSLLMVAEDRSGVGVIGFAAAAFPAASLRTVELQALATDGAHRRQGVARGLCLETIAWARGNGGELLELEVRSASAGARALYRSVGFGEVGRRPRYYADPADDAVLMSLVLH